MNTCKSFMTSAVMWYDRALRIFLGGSERADLQCQVTVCGTNLWRYTCQIKGIFPHIKEEMRNVLISGVGSLFSKGKGILVTLTDSSSWRGGIMQMKQIPPISTESTWWTDYSCNAECIDVSPIMSSHLLTCVPLSCVFFSHHPLKAQTTSVFLFFSQNEWRFERRLSVVELNTLIHAHVWRDFALSDYMISLKRLYVGAPVYFFSRWWQCQGVPIMVGHCFCL